jgi:class 3 adenylate cyclase/anti-sigma regulatory factor (Ser/Thr protein kinase)
VLDIRISPLISRDDILNGLVITLDDLSEENRIRRIFTRYVSDRVVDMVLRPDTRPALGGDFRDVVVVFTDLRGFTRIQETQGPEETVRMLNEYYEVMFDIIARHNGTLSRIAGDGLMILYGAPISVDDDMGRAIHTVLDMREALILLNERRTAAGKEEIGIGVGISAGRVLAGNVGSPRRMEYTVIGDPVNIAARLVDIADSGQILVSEDVFLQARDRFYAHYVRSIRVKGKQRPINIYALKGTESVGTELEGVQEDEGAMQKPSGEIDLTIPLLPEMELAAGKTAAAVAAFMRLDENTIEEIRLALIEACVNAIEHSKSKDRKIHINFVIHDDALEITIQDFGEGFDTEDIRRRMAKRVSSDKLLKRGWGLTIMEELMDDVEVQSGGKGTTIRMVKKR